MRCFYHRGTEAVGVCKHCQKGLCPECLVDLGNGISCPGRCEEEARAQHDTLAQLRATAARTAEIYTGTGLGSIAFGVIFLIGSRVMGLRELSLFLVPVGILLIIGGAVLCVWGRRLKGR